ncbi:MAG: hypothetical protein CME84_02955 [Henriciella sp.]|jgi:hypothetical protein|uniref:hypothetical protein n=1 Tax=uncultured Henriciella sp. TaxID=1608424 RepID=UPI000C540CED|nr:hypothetical protein [Henriciella sp.]MBF35580.1 hypothetical protein [Hyphomonadaceae bacterium]|tara:strand:- start:1405 stop:1812 length:408 start_codon:yes stop_codon:yes gene_type:complete
MTDPLLTQYHLLSDQRLHFGRLYWQSIAFLFALLIGIAAVSRGMSLIPYSVGLIGCGAITALMGFVADRVRRLEGRYEDLLEAIEIELRQQGHAGIQTAPKSGSLGARFVITMGLYALGAGIILLGVLEWIAQAS